VCRCGCIAEIDVIGAAPVSSVRPLGAVVLAAGLGTRMRSTRAKVLHEIAGLPLVHYPLRAIGPLGPEKIAVVVGHQAEAVAKAARTAGLAGVETALQAEQHGTGHAVRCALPVLRGFDGDVLILYGDVPFIQTETLKRLVDTHRDTGASLSLLTVCFNDPTGYGRIVRDEAGRVRGIVEHKDATPAQRAITEINPGFYCIRSTALALLDELRANNAQGELYLTDLVGLVAGRGERIEAVQIPTDRADEVAGINTRAELARMETVMRLALIDRWMEAGVSFEDPATAYIGADVTIGADTTIGPNVTLRGHTTIGTECRLAGTNAFDNVRIGARARVGFGCIGQGGAVAAGATVPAFTRITTARSTKKRTAKPKPRATKAPRRKR
jgi:bifunctional UDP-N-acetylglucosamine pyrophosphorylase / glucosamine-1-phosphate N-acetyltransferase